MELSAECVTAHWLRVASGCQTGFVPVSDLHSRTGVPRIWKRASAAAEFQYCYLLAGMRHGQVPGIPVVKQLRDNNYEENFHDSHTSKYHRVSQIRTFRWGKSVRVGADRRIAVAVPNRASSNPCQSLSRQTWVLN